MSCWLLTVVAHADVSPGEHGLCPFLAVCPSPQPSAWDGGRSSVSIPKRVESLPPSPLKGSAGSTRERAVRPTPQRVTQGTAEGKGGLDAVERNQVPWDRVLSCVHMRRRPLASLPLHLSLNESRRARGGKCAR